MIKKYFRNLLVAVDQFFNAVLLGDPDETMSSRFGKWLNLPQNTLRWKIAYIICRILHYFDKEHCNKSIEPDEGRRDLIK